MNDYTKSGKGSVPAALPSPRLSPMQQLKVSIQPQGRLNMSPQHCYLPWHHLAMAISMDIAPRRNQARLNRLWSRVLKWNGYAPFFFLLHLWFPGERWFGQPHHGVSLIPANTLCLPDQKASMSVGRSSDWRLWRARSLLFLPYPSLLLLKHVVQPLRFFQMQHKWNFIINDLTRLSKWLHMCMGVSPKQL